MFRDALDVGDTIVNGAMKTACVNAIASITKCESTDDVASVYKDEEPKFGRT